MASCSVPPTSVGKRVFRALYEYIPARDSPNDNPDAELQLQADELLLVHGDLDEVSRSSCVTSRLTSSMPNLSYN